MDYRLDLIVYSSLPIVFMFHEFEEILFLKYWLNKDKNYLRNKFGRIGQKIYAQYSKFSTAGFVLAVAEEFILISVLTYISIIYLNYYLWFTVFMGFFIHIIIHIFQWLIYRRYLPTIVSSILVLPYCIYCFIDIMNKNVLEIEWIIVCSIVGIICVLINLKFIHYIGHKFSRWENRII
ncbi:MAG: HXXEE domain-containing protein [Syntrophomonadaceae bacterium]|jgi:hypothetical protein|nr:HXXEE domain-containing protein [Syntrophomonadaceae bacterium]